MPTQPTDWRAMQHDDGKMSHMAALVIGIHVRPRGAQPVEPPVSQEIRLLVRSRANVYGKYVGYGFVRGDSPMAAMQDSFSAPGPTLELTRGKRVAITLVNQAFEPIAVHWHGIELESFPDGVPGWSGVGKTTMPFIMPGDSLTVRFTPPRAGTFMYHTHFNDYIQLSTGLYGPMIVTAPGQQFDPEFDKIFVLSRGGTDDEKDPFLINGSNSPPPVELLARKRYRLRFIGITPGPPLEITLERNGRPDVWRPVAKDGADLIGRERMVLAKVTLFPGETYDFEFQPASTGEFRLKAVNSFFKLQTIAPLKLRKD
jgi:FtsP/CotA-like multicopper oxidase with cupredoxin domain